MIASHETLIFYAVINSGVTQNSFKENLLRPVTELQGADDGSFTSFSGGESEP